MNNQEISFNAIQQRLMNLETEIIMKDSLIETLQKRVEELDKLNNENENKNSVIAELESKLTELTSINVDNESKIKDLEHQLDELQKYKQKKKVEREA